MSRRQKKPAYGADVFGVHLDGGAHLISGGIHPNGLAGGLFVGRATRHPPPQKKRKDRRPSRVMMRVEGAVQ